jgi:3-oxoacyl-[acyl-carrier-protein] synthase II
MEVLQQPFSGGGAVPAHIAGSSVRTCFGDGAATFAALLEGRCGVGDLRFFKPARLNVRRGYQIAEDGSPPGYEPFFRASRWLTECVREALEQSGVDPERERVVAIVGTGLRELRAVERWSLETLEAPAESLHFRAAIQEAAPQIREVITLSNACSASGHALALAQDLIELGETDAVIAAGADEMTESMLAMIGRFAETPTERVRPFDRRRTGALLGEGAAAVVVVPCNSTHPPMATVLGTGLSCDAQHQTAPDADGIRRAMLGALSTGRRGPEDVDLVVAHGTGTLLNDPVEADLIRETLAGNEDGPWITAIKGAVGHNSGASALVNLDVAIRCMRAGQIPPVSGLSECLEEGKGLRLVMGDPVRTSVKLAIVNAFGFGGVNAVTLIESISRR